MSDARGQDTRFARAWPGRDAHGAVGTHHRRELLLIHAAKQRERGDGDLIYGGGHGRTRRRRSSARSARSARIRSGTTLRHRLAGVARGEQ